MPTEGPLENSLYLLTQGNAEQMHALYGTLRPTSVDAAIKMLKGQVAAAGEAAMPVNSLPNGADDANNWQTTQPRLAWASHQVANTPDIAKTWRIDVTRVIDTSILQVAQSLGPSGEIWRRWMSSSGWSPWVRIDAGAATWSRGEAPSSGATYKTLEAGQWTVSTGGVATALQLPVTRQGWLTVMVKGATRHVEFRTDDVTAVSGQEIWTIASDHNGSWGRAAWQRIRLSHGLALPGADYKTLSGGDYFVASGSLATDMGLPVARQGWVTVEDGQSPQRSVRYVTNDVSDSAPLEVWQRSTDHTGAWNRPWRRIYPAMTAAPVRAAMLADEQYSQVGGPVKTNGATPVALVWDDFPNAVRDKLMPLLRARNLPVTLALCSRTMSAERAPYLGGEGITWPEVDAWVAAGHTEIANHSATHMDAATLGGIRDEVVTGLAELQALTPSGKVLCWVQPSVVYDAGFDNGVSTAAWADTFAGQTIMGHHAYSTGTRNLRADASVPAAGRPVQGVGRVWTDTGTATAKARVQSLAGTGRGVIISGHADRIDKGTGYVTTAELAGFLDWLVAEQNAGRVKLLLLSQWAWADARTTVQPTPDTGWRDITSAGVLLNGWTATSIKIRRIADRVTLRVAGLSSSAATGDGWIQLPGGFRLISGTAVMVSGAIVVPIRADAGGALLSPRPVTADARAAEVSWLCDQAFPTTLPGTPA